MRPTRMCERAEQRLFRVFTTNFNRPHQSKSPNL